jgi:predicted transcriptional regulator
MEQETLFTASKWDILKILSSGGKSPLQLAKLSNTSVANISQQLRLLEMAGLVQCTRISNRDKGQPRIIYSLVGNQSFLITSSKDFVEKKFLNLTDYNKIILKIWFLDKPKLHYFLEKTFWSIEPLMSKIDVLALDVSAIMNDDIHVIVLSKDSDLKKDLKKIQIKNSEGLSKNITFDIKNSLSPSSKYYVLYDPLAIMSKKDEKLVGETGVGL